MGAAPSTAGAPAEVQAAAPSARPDATPRFATPTEARVAITPLDATGRATLAGGALVTMWRNLVGSTFRTDREAFVGLSPTGPSVSAWAPITVVEGGPAVVAGTRHRTIGPENTGRSVEGGCSSSSASAPSRSRAAR